MMTRNSGTGFGAARRPHSATSTTTRSTGDDGKRPPLQVIRRGSRNLIKRSQSRRLVPFVLLGGILALAVVFAVLLEQVVLAQSAFKLASVREQVADAEARHQKLLLEAAKLESSDRIEQFARAELGMVDPSPDQVEYVSADIFPRARRGRAPGRRMAGELPAGGATAAGSSTTDPAP
jgi:cell division protein FtsL